MLADRPGEPDECGDVAATGPPKPRLQQHGGAHALELEHQSELFFFFQAEDGIRVRNVTGVQTCALPISSGPSAVTWSPDGRDVIYSMQGALWRQQIGSGVAVQVTGDAGYDYQPDWSPDGRFVVFARYANDAIELQLLDLATGAVRPVTANGAVNVEPRWSPDGGRIAFVSTAYDGRWHIFALPVAGGTPGDATRLTEDNDSKLPRYYYSAWDHYLSPTWSPDGKELILVSNRGHIHGSGGFWRMPATPGAPLRGIRYG